MTEDEMVGWHHQLNGHECEHSVEDGKGQGSLACCSSKGHKESDTTERLNNKGTTMRDNQSHHVYYVSGANAREVLKSIHQSFKAGDNTNSALETWTLRPRAFAAT